MKNEMIEYHQALLDLAKEIQSLRINQLKIVEATLPLLETLKDIQQLVYAKEKNPNANSMTENAKKVLTEAAMMTEENENPDKYQHLSPDDDIFDHKSEEESERKQEKEYEKDERSAHTHEI